MCAYTDICKIINIYIYTYQIISVHNISTSMAAQYLLYLSYLFLSGKCLQSLQILEAAARLGPASDLDQPIFCRADACPRDPMEALQEGLTVAENRGNHQKSLQKKT